MCLAKWLPLLFAMPLLASITPAAERQAQVRMQAVTVSAGLGLPLAQPEIRVFKAAHRLELWASGKCLKRYSVALGQRGLADKRRQGDHLTPEGHFYLCNRHPGSAFHLFLGISYPGEEAAERGLHQGLVTKAQRDRILAQLRRKASPLWDTQLGGTVGIHGGGSGADWTWGCVALEDADIEELWVACPLGTPIVIEP